MVGHVPVARTRAQRHWLPAITPEHVTPSRHHGHRTSNAMDSAGTERLSARAHPAHVHPARRRRAPRPEPHLERGTRFGRAGVCATCAGDVRVDGHGAGRPRHRRPRDRAAARIRECFDGATQRARRRSVADCRVRLCYRDRHGLPAVDGADRHLRSRPADHRCALGLSGVVRDQPGHLAAPWRCRAGMDGSLGRRHGNPFPRGLHRCPGDSSLASVHAYRVLRTSQADGFR